jgi:hypothetical protein
VSTSSLSLRWRRRDAPLAAAAVVASGAVVAELRVATLTRVAAGARLRACASWEWLIVLGDRADLPWADGATYLGWDGGVLAPTLVEPWPCADLLREPLRRLSGQQAGLVALLPGLVLAGPLPREPVDPTRLDTDV